jgi:four helix bundle protein
MNQPSVNTFRDLIVWQKAMDLVTEVYKITKTFPKEEVYGLISQMRRCAVSIPSNIAEGHSRHSRKDFLRYLEIAMGSIFELQTQNEIASKLNYIAEASVLDIFDKSREVERMLSSMMRKLKLKDDPF